MEIAASSTEDLEYLTSVPPSEALEIAKQLILNILDDQQHSAVKCARRIEQIWTFVGSLTDQDLTTTKIQAWRDDIEATLGKDELDRQLRLSRSESALEGYRRRIRTAWKVEVEEFLEPQYYDPLKQLSYGLLKTLAEISARVPLDKARRDVVAAIQERIRDTTTPRLSKAPFLVPHDLKRLKECGNDSEGPGPSKQLVWQDQPQTSPSADTRSEEPHTSGNDTAPATLSRKKRKTRRDGTYHLREKRNAVRDPTSIEPNENNTTTADHLPNSPQSSAVANAPTRRRHPKLVHTTFDRIPLGTLQQQPVERARLAATPPLDDFKGYENEHLGYASDDDDACLSPLHGYSRTPSTAGSFNDPGNPQTIEDEELTVPTIDGEDPLRDDEVACLAPGEWIVGSVIDRCVSLLSACGFPGVQVWSNTVLDRPTGTRLRLSTSTERVLIPCHHSNHWVLGQYDLKARTIALYDSLPDGDATKLYTKLSVFLTKVNGQNEGTISTDWGRCAARLPLQPNTSDCGVYTMICLLYRSVTLEVPLSFDGELWRYLFKAMFLRETQQLPPVAEEPNDCPTPPSWSGANAAVMAAFKSIKAARLKHRSHLNVLQKRLDSVKSGLLVLDRLQSQCQFQFRHADDPEPARKELEDLMNFETRLASMTKTETDLSRPVKAKIREVRRIVERYERRRKYLDDAHRGIECAIQTASRSREEARSTIEVIRKEDTNLGALLRTEADELEAQAGSQKKNQQWAEELYQSQDDLVKRFKQRNKHNTKKLHQSHEYRVTTLSRSHKEKLWMASIKYTRDTESFIQSQRKKLQKWDHRFKEEFFKARNKF
ncbi:MAG: hypothetical protein Q9184_006448 [Pyrenodesmia sp. 2 TL-2023]